MNNVETRKALDEQTRDALSGPADAEAIEFERRWYLWGEIRRVADEVTRYLTRAGIGERVPVAFAPRNRPVAIAAELGMIAARHTIRIWHRRGRCSNSPRVTNDKPAEFT